MVTHMQAITEQSFLKYLIGRVDSPEFWRLGVLMIYRLEGPDLLLLWNYFNMSITCIWLNTLFYIETYIKISME